MTKLGLAGVLILAAAAAVATGCTCSKDKCLSDYSLMDKTEAACLAAFPELSKIVHPTPGPIIIIRPVAGPVLEWSVDPGTGAVVQTGVGSAWVSGKIRSDFMGDAITDFTVHSTSSMTYTNAIYVVFTTKVGGDTYDIALVRGPQDKARWYIAKNGGVAKRLDPIAPVPGQVPIEFTGTLTAGSFREVIEGVDLADVNFFRVGM